MTRRGLVALIEPDADVQHALSVLLQGERWQLCCLDDTTDLCRTLCGAEFTAVISESMVPDGSAEEILRVCREHGVPVIFTGHSSSVQGAVDLVRQGAEDYLQKPFPQARLLRLLEHLADRHNGGRREASSP